MTRRVEKTTTGEDCVSFYDADGKFQGAVHDSDFVNRPTYIISDETIATLEAIINEQGKTLYPKIKGGASNPSESQMWRLVADINECANWFDTDFVFGTEVENQKALRALLKAFKELGEEGGRTVLEHYVKRGRLLNRNGKRVWQGVLDPDNFTEAVRSLIRGKESGGGRRSSYPEKIRKMLFYMGYKLFLDLELEPTEAEGGYLGRFMKAIMEDPAIKSLGLPPETMKNGIKAAKKEVESGTKTFQLL